MPFAHASWDYDLEMDYVSKSRGFFRVQALYLGVTNQSNLIPCQFRRLAMSSEESEVDAKAKHWLLYVLIYVSSEATSAVSCIQWCLFLLSCILYYNNMFFELGYVIHYIKTSIFWL